MSNPTYKIQVNVEIELRDIAAELYDLVESDRIFAMLKDYFGDKDDWGTLDRMITLEVEFNPEKTEILSIVEADNG